MQLDRDLVVSYIHGDVGEAITANELRSLGLTVIRNLYIPTDKYETEVDLVALSEYGVYVIENKNYHSKTIYGNVKTDYWLCQYYLDYTEKLYNPVKQNKKHLEAIKALLKDEGITTTLFNVVIFNNMTKLVMTGFNGNAFVLNDFLQKYKTITPIKKKKVLTPIQIEKISDILKEYSDTTFERKCDFALGLKAM